MKIPDEKIEEVRLATDLVELVSQYVTLKKRGKGYTGLCPFHQEKTPSFSVDPVRGLYHCFGCGEGGTAFTFVMKMEHVGFPEALQTLAKKAGIDLPQKEEDPRIEQEAEALYHVNQMACDFFVHCLLRTDEGRQALQYITGRGFEMKTMEAFRIGYAPERWDGLVEDARQKAVPVAHLEKAGLVIPRKEGGYYDRFRGRLMFPVQNAAGRVVGFGGRIMTDVRDQPKYLNSPETLIYQKSRLLYGLYQSRQGIRREGRVILTEGYTDVMRLYQCGLDYGVASAGTSLTEEQAHLLSRYTKEVYLLYDGDEAGLNAAFRGSDILLEAGHHVLIVTLPEGFDPDSFLAGNPPEEFGRRLVESKTVASFKIDRMEAEGRLKDSHDRAQAARSIVESLSRIRDPIERNLMIRDLSERLGIHESVLVRAMPRRRDRPIPDADMPAVPGKGEMQAELNLARILLEAPEKWSRVIFHFLKADSFRDERARQLADRLFQDYTCSRATTAQDVLAGFSREAEMSRFLSGLMSEELDESIDRSQLGLDCVLRLKQADIRNQIRRTQEQIRAGQDKGLDVSGLARTYSELKKTLENMKSEIVSEWKKRVEI
ncbi:DNA primase [bacterium]|nr:DNA primase [bacterium]